MEGKNDDNRKMIHDIWADKQLQEYGWYAHFVPEDPDFPNHINYHTHGLLENFGHPDLQICFPVSTEVAHGIFSEIVDVIKSGGQFQAGNKYAGILAGDFIIELIHAVECGRMILRIVFPNKSGTYEGDIFSSQFEQTYLDS